MKKITLLIPCYNEEKSIGAVIDSVPKEKLKKAGYNIEILVIDNNCTDKTAELAKKKGARVVEEKEKGKGNAIKRGFKSISKDTDYVVMVDGDNTYNPKEMLRLIEPLDSGFCDVVIGSRLEGKMDGHALSITHRMANWFFTFLTRKFYKNANVTDTCTGYFAWTKKAINILNGYITSRGFAIEAEMITKMSRLGLHIYSVPITYSPRHEETKSNLNPLGDGLRITRMLLKNINWKPAIAK
jgi:glycosyltransferase involved in cell wall biosynthesis